MGRCVHMGACIASAQPAAGRCVPDSEIVQVSRGAGGHGTQNEATQRPATDVGMRQDDVPADLGLAPTIFAFSVFHCLTVSLAYGGEGLGTAWGRELALQKLADAGFAT